MSIETENDEIDIEIQTLEAIYEDNIKIELENEFINYKMTVNPMTAGDESSQYSCFDILIKTQISGYPETVPAKFEILKSASLTDSTRVSLCQELHEIINERNSEGEICVYDVLNAGFEWITEHNLPETECSICLDMLNDGGKIVRTDCYHFFHVECLSDHVIQCMEAFEKKLAEDDNPCPDAKPMKADIFCPECREDLPQKIVGQLDLNRVPQVNDAQLLTLDSETKAIMEAQRKKMEKIFELQRAKGGLIVDTEQVMSISTLGIGENSSSTNNQVGDSVNDIGNYDLETVEAVETVEKVVDPLALDKLTDNDVSILKNLHNFQIHNPPQFETDPKKWTRQSWKFAYTQYASSPNHRNQRKSKMDENDMHEFFTSFFQEVNVDRKLFPVTFAHFDWRGLTRFQRKMPTKPYTMSNLDKPFEMWSDREKAAVCKLFRNPNCDLKATLTSGKMVIDETKQTNKNTTSTSKSGNNATTSATVTKHLYENDVRALKSLKFMFESNDIHWSKLRFKVHPSEWSTEHMKHAESILQSAELLKSLMKYFDM